MSRGAAGVDPDVFGIAPVRAAEIALERAGIGWGDVAVVELNEAFASQCLADIGEWKDLDPDKVNPNGGAIALGHPLGASGVRILGSLAHELRRRGGGYGVAALCIGVGQGLAIVLQGTPAPTRSSYRYTYTDIYRYICRGITMTEELQAESREERQIYDPIGPTPTSYLREPEGAHPPLDFEGYKSTALRHPKQPLIYMPQTITEITGPQLGPVVMGESDHDLTIQHDGEPIGERITVSGRVFDTEGKPLRGTLVEIWQANAAGRYKHRWDRWPAPLDPNFSGAGRCITDDEGRYQFTTIKPGPIRGESLQRLAASPHPLLADGPRIHPASRDPDVLPGRSLLPLRPDLQLGQRSGRPRANGLALLDPRHGSELGGRLRVRHLSARTRRHAVRGGALIFETPPSQTVGPYFAIGLPFDVGPFVVPESTPGAIHISGTIYDGAGVPIPDFLLETWQADPDGRFADLHGYGGASELPGFRGFARYGLEDGDGTFDIVTVKPGPVPGLGEQTQAPHIDLSVFARGMTAA